VSAISIRQSWNKLGFSSGSTSSSLEQPMQEEEPVSTEECETLGISEAEREESLVMDKCETGMPVMTDADIISTVQSGDITEEEEECAAPVITHQQAEEAFDTCLLRLENQEEATAMNIMLLRGLRALAVKNKYNSQKQKHTDYF